MSASNSLHYQLCQEGAKYIIQRRAKDGWCTPYKWSTVELMCCGCEKPDVWACNGCESVIIEVKTSHADFINDKKKYVRSEQAEKDGNTLGNYRYYLCPEGLIKEEEVPDKWGLLYWNGKKITRIKKSEYHEVNKLFDIFVLSSIISREFGVHKIFDYRNTNKKI